MTDRKQLEEISQMVGHLIACAIDDVSEKYKVKSRIGFALLVFDFGGKGNLAWISNAEREDMIKALKEFIEKNGGESVLRH